MAWESNMVEEELQQCIEALSVLHHHKFFERYGNALKESALNSMRGASDTELVSFVRRYQAQADLAEELNQLSGNAAKTIAHYQGED